MSSERLNELAAAFGSGDISAAEKSELLSLLESVTEAEKIEAGGIIDSAALLSLTLPPESPGASLKAKILARTTGAKPTSADALTFMRRAAEMEWQPMKVKGAYVKLLSLNPERGYGVALGKLDPGTSYPSHVHHGPEDVLVLTGDLWIGDTHLLAGDFHHAEAGSRHDVNHSDEGCTILIVLTKEDLMAQMI